MVNEVKNMKNELVIFKVDFEKLIWFGVVRLLGFSDD